MLQEACQEEDRRQNDNLGDIEDGQELDYPPDLVDASTSSSLSVTPQYSTPSSPRSSHMPSPLDVDALTRKLSDVAMRQAFFEPAETSVPNSGPRRCRGRPSKGSQLPQRSALQLDIPKMHNTATDPVPPGGVSLPKNSAAKRRRRLQRALKRASAAEGGNNPLPQPKIRSSVSLRHQTHKTIKSDFNSMNSPVARRAYIGLRKTISPRLRTLEELTDAGFNVIHWDGE